MKTKTQFNLVMILAAIIFFFLQSCAVTISTKKKVHDWKFQSPVKKVTTWKC